MSNTLRAEVLVATPQCVMCGKRTGLWLPVAAVNELRRGRKVQSVFPDWTPDQRELMISGTHSECWDKMFGAAGGAAEREETDPCQIGTVGCSVDHDRVEGDCETW